MSTVARLERLAINAAKRQLRAGDEKKALSILAAAADRIKATK